MQEILDFSLNALATFYCLIFILLAICAMYVGGKISRMGWFNTIAMTLIILWRIWK